MVIVNPSLLNPGPNNLSVVYQNIQGFIPFSDLGVDNPKLDRNKLAEFHGYLNVNKPDIIVLNETWLKPSITDNEIINDNQYKLFRKDRSPKSHPPDPNNPSKFRKKWRWCTYCH